MAQTLERQRISTLLCWLNKNQRGGKENTNYTLFADAHRWRYHLPDPQLIGGFVEEYRGTGRAPGFVLEFVRQAVYPHLLVSRNPN